ncbi:MAG TPA: pyridoxine 5'-phosphate synthase [Aestuariivirgaceae bacterium]|nr:pyridoxine 5'-phosphate synthase [Aestuariivirgaceae bacterium]
MTCKLSVNVNAIAYLRNRRNLAWPSVTNLSRIALQAGAYGITVHPRPDERHIRRTDVFELAKLVRGEFADAEYNIEGNPDARFVEIVEQVRPDQVTLVPDDVRQATSDHGWDIAAHTSYLTDVIARLKSAGMRVSIFIDPDPRAPELAAKVGADRVEIYTGLYGVAPDAAAQTRALDHVVETGRAAAAAGIGLNAGHDLTRDNLPGLVAALPNLQEVSIGHAITGDALAHGMADAVRLYRAACGDPVAEGQ